MIVVTTPTGHIGSVLVKLLLDAGENVRVVARDPEKLAEEVRGRVEVVQGSLDEEATMSRALEGAESLFLVVPPSFTTEDTDAYYRRFTKPSLSAAKAQGVKRIVAVSATGHGVPMEAGVVTAALKRDERIAEAGLDFRALWCPSFMENMLNQAQAIKHQGMFFTPGDPDLKSRHVATRDIAASGAKLLLDREWKGQGGLAVLGPEDLSWNDIAAVLSDVCGKPVRCQAIPYEAYKAQLMQYGASEHFAQGLTTMMQAKDKGLDNAEPRTAENTTPTSYRQWAEEVLKPAVA